MCFLSSRRNSVFESYVMNDGQSVSVSWCRPPSGAHDQMIVTLWQLTVLSLWDAIFEKTDLSFARVCCRKSFVSTYKIITWYNTSHACEFSFCPGSIKQIMHYFSSSSYNGSLVILWNFPRFTVVCDLHKALNLPYVYNYITKCTIKKQNSYKITRMDIYSA
jgi:hypothetical protein